MHCSFYLCFLCKTFCSIHLWYMTPLRFDLLVITIYADCAFLYCSVMFARSSASSHNLKCNMTLAMLYVRVPNIAVSVYVLALFTGS